MEMNEITDAVETNSSTIYTKCQQGGKASLSESSVDNDGDDPAFFNFLKELAMEQFYTNFSERGIVEINHLEDVSEADAQEFKFLSTFQFRRLLRKYREIWQSKISSSTCTKPSTSSTILYRTSHQSSVVSLPRSFRNFFETRDGMGNVVINTNALKRQFKNLWHEVPQNPTQHMSNSIILQMAASRMQFAKSQRECELWCRKERAKRTKLMLASCKTPVVDTWTSYYKQMSVYGKLEMLKQKYPTAEPFLQLDSATVTSSIYEILCKYLVGLYDIQEFARKSVAECKSSIIASTNEGIN